MFDSNFDPYQELVDLRIETEMLKSNFQVLIKSHNRLNQENAKLRRWLTEQQQELFELTHRLDRNRIN